MSEQTTGKYPRVKKVKILKQIILPGKQVYHAWPMQSKIDLDTKSPVNKKTHQLYFQQGQNYGAVGDRCTYLSHEELFKLQDLGFIKIN